MNFFRFYFLAVSVKRPKTPLRPNTEPHWHLPSQLRCLLWSLWPTQWCQLQCNTWSADKVWLHWKASLSQTVTNVCIKNLAKFLSLNEKGWYKNSKLNLHAIFYPKSFTGDCPHFALCWARCQISPQMMTTLECLLDQKYIWLNILSLATPYAWWEVLGSLCRELFSDPLHPVLYLLLVISAFS